MAQALSGRGLEIGAGSQPMPCHAGMRVEYLDRLTADDQRRHHPELARAPFVDPDVVGDAEHLESIPDASFDFLIAAHVLEHLPNPIRALEEWCRVVKPGGLIYVVLPDKRRTFDRRRQRTPLAHLVMDYYRPSKERDFEHFLDYALNVHLADANTALPEADRLKTIDFSIHYHVFAPGDGVALVKWFAAHVRPLEIVRGPVTGPLCTEFHLLLRVGAAARDGGSRLSLDRNP